MPLPVQTPVGAADPRERRVYVWWFAGLAFLLALGLFCLLVVGPLLEVHRAIRSIKDRPYVPNLPEEDMKAFNSQAVTELGGPRKALARLRLYLRMPRWVAPDQDTAIGLLAYCGQPALPVLRNLLADEAWVVRISAIDALAQMGPQAASAVPALAALTQAADKDERYASFRALGAIGVPAVPALVEALERPAADANVRYQAVVALSRIGPGAARAVPALLRSMSNSCGEVRWYSVLALGQIGKAAEPAIPALIDALNIDYPNADMRSVLCGTLGRIGCARPEVITSLRQSLQDVDAAVRCQAAKALGRIGPAAREAIPALEEMVAGDTDGAACLTAAEAIVKIHGETARAEPGG